MEPVNKRGGWKHCTAVVAIKDGKAHLCGEPSIRTFRRARLCRAHARFAEKHGKVTVFERGAVFAMKTVSK
jgi:hypothetical protein